MNKNIGPFLAFDKDWFKKHQKGLIWLLNSKFISRWFRWVLSIDVPYKIDKIEPNALWYNDKVEFRTHPKYGKRLYFAFRPLWWLIHFWDWAIADRFVPKLSYGFLTLTAYPAAGANYPVDGIVESATDTQTWASWRTHAGSSASDTATDDFCMRIQASSTTDRWFRGAKGIYLFDTSSLTASASISSVVFSLFGTNKADSLSVTPDINIYSSAPASTSALVAGDYDSIGSTDYATAITYASFSTSAYNDFTLNATGIAAVDKTGTTKLGTRNKNYDVDNVAPTWTSSVQSFMTAYYADQTGTTNDPKLVVTYTLSSIKTVDGLAVASVKTVDGLAIASVKTFNGLA